MPYFEYDHETHQFKDMTLDDMVALPCENTLTTEAIEATVMALIEDRKNTRDTIAQAYADLLRYDWGRGAVSYIDINTAIINRWNRHTLDWIKRKAWKMVG